MNMPKLTLAHCGPLPSQSTHVYKREHLINDRNCHQKNTFQVSTLFPDIARNSASTFLSKQNAIGNPIKNYKSQVRQLESQTANNGFFLLMLITQLCQKSR